MGDQPTPLKAGSRDGAGSDARHARKPRRGEDNEEREPGGEPRLPRLKEQGRDNARKMGGENKGPKHERNEARQGAERWQGCEAFTCPCHKTEPLVLR